MVWLGNFQEGRGSKQDLEKVLWWCERGMPRRALEKTCNKSQHYSSGKKTLLWFHTHTRTHTHTHTHTSPLEPGPRAGVGVAMLGLPAWDSPDWNRSSEGGPEHKSRPQGRRNSDRPTRPQGNQTLQKSWRPFPYKGNGSPEFFLRLSGNLRGKSIDSAVA